MTTYAQARYWILTIPHADFLPYKPIDVVFIRGQLECGDSTGYLHWQCVVAFKKKIRLGGVKLVFGSTCHAEPTRSNAALEYVWKDDTRVEGTQFELGELPVQRGSSSDWDAIADDARAGRMASIPSDIYIRYFFLFILFTYTLGITTTSSELQQIIYTRLESSALYTVLSAQLEQGSLEGPGTKPVTTLILK